MLARAQMKRRGVGRRRTPMRLPGRAAAITRCKHAEGPLRLRSAQAFAALCLSASPRLRVTKSSTEETSHATGRSSRVKGGGPRLLLIPPSSRLRVSKWENTAVRNDRREDGDWLHEWNEVQDHRYDPGHWLGRVHPFYRRWGATGTSVPFGLGLIAIGLLSAIAALWRPPHARPATLGRSSAPRYRNGA
jgi:hypothetical protein